MTPGPALLGAAVGGSLGLGCWLVVTRLVAVRRRRVVDRVGPYLRDLVVPSARWHQDRPTSLPRLMLQALALGVGRVLGGEQAIRVRLARAGRSGSVHEFRIEQALWGISAFVAAAVPAGFMSAAQPGRGPALFLLCCTALCLGVLLRENRLSAQVRIRERKILHELPVVAELLALSVAAGESPVAGLDRVVRRCGGEFAVDLRDLLARTRTGTPLTEALDDLGARSGLAPVTRFAHGLAVAVERGTPLAEVLHAQAGDVREAGRRALIESAARREVLMMVPVVFLILPTVVVFAFWPGLVGLQLFVP